jgi:hypothetical protein
MRRFYKRKSDGKEFTEYGNICGGQLLTKFDKKTGTPYGNSEYQIFVAKGTLAEDFLPIDFKIDSTEAMNNIVASHLGSIVSQMRNYGIAEEMARNFEEFYHSSPNSLDVYRDMVKDEKCEFEDYQTGDDDYHYSEAEELFPFLHQGLVPILKKMLIELEGTKQ